MTLVLTLHLQHHGGRRDLPSPTRVTALPSQHHHSAVGRIIWPGNTRAFDTTSTVMFDDKQSLLQEVSNILHMTEQRVNYTLIATL